MREETRNRIRAKAVSIWLKADADVHHAPGETPRPTARCCRPPIRPATVGRLLERARAGLPERRSRRSASRDVPHDKIVDECIEALARAAVRRRAQPTEAIRRDERHADDRAAETFRSDHRRRRARRARLRHRHRPRRAAIAGRSRRRACGPACARPSSPTATSPKHWLEQDREPRCRIAGIATSRIIVDEGEGSKSYAGLEQVSEALIAARSSATIW